jgi:hypothetical protein
METEPPAEIFGDANRHRSDSAWHGCHDAGAMPSQSAAEDLKCVYAFDNV